MCHLGNMTLYFNKLRISNLRLCGSSAVFTIIVPNSIMTSQSFFEGFKIKNGENNAYN